MNIERGDYVVMKAEPSRRYVVLSDLYNTPYSDTTASVLISEVGSGFQRTVPVTELKYSTGVA